MIVRLDDDLELSAQQLADSHLIKSIVDGVQAASNYLWKYHCADTAFDAKHFFQRQGIESTIVRAFAPHQELAPESVWVAKSVDNYMWLHQYLVELGIEYRCRFSNTNLIRSYAARTNLSNCLKVIDQLPAFDSHQFPLEFLSSIDDWHNEYRKNAHRLEWSMREIPEWIN